jgi:dTDP-glucose pyrophosphorylase
MNKDEWRKAVLNMSASLHDAVRCLNESSYQIVLIEASDGTLLGTLTDGDIRRGSLRGYGLDSSVETLLVRDPLVVPPELGRDAVMQLMHSNRIHQVPVVDTTRRLVGLHLFGELLMPQPRSSLMVIMAGGRGSRLLPHTENCPKPLLPIGGKPMLEHIIERAKLDGFDRFVLAVHYLGDMIEDYFGDGGRWQVRIEYLREQSPLGTAGAIQLLDPKPDEPFVVSNGDVLTDIRYGELLDYHCYHNAAATMAVRLHEWRHPFGVVRTQGVDIVGFEEKPVARTYINAGVYVLSPQVFAHLGIDQPCDMPTLFSRLQMDAARTIVYPMYEPWLDVGRDVDLRLAREIHGASA